MNQPPQSDAAAAPGTAGLTAVRTVGVAGGGQLAQMMVPPARALGLRLVALDPDAACSAAQTVDELVVGPLASAPHLETLASKADVVTLEIERVNAEALASIENTGKAVRPSAATLATIQDKLIQKQFLVTHGIATSRFKALASPAALDDTFPVVWKARRDGYDGRGVQVLRSAQDAAGLPETPALLEELVDIDYELAVLVARDVGGSIVLYPLSEIVMDPQAHVMDSVIVPAAKPPAIEAECRRLAAAAAEALDYVGILALEFFVTRAGEVLVNEMSPRPHNSGHYTIEACDTSQFEQHLRAVAGLSLGGVGETRAAITFNLLGRCTRAGPPRYVGFDGWAASDGVYPHSYDKPEVRPGRKMGHVTVVADSREEAIAMAARIRDQIRVENADE